MSRRIVIASRNQHKIRELADMLRDLDVEVISAADVADLPDIVEDGETFVANATKKALVTAKATGFIALADDSGLEVDALDGKPGVYSARFAGEPSDDEKNNDKLLRLLENVPDDQRGAQFCSVIAIATPSGEVETSTGICRGRIAHERLGGNGFGYDPLFIVPEYNQSFAQLGEELKNKISHRARAIAQAKPLIEKIIKK